MSDPNLMAVIRSVLLSQAAQKISFTLGTVQVDGNGLLDVYYAVTNKNNGGKGIGIRVAPMPKGTAAQYSTWTNDFIFPRKTFGATPSERMTILHESVHAMQDLAFGGRTRRGSKSTTEVENEAASYVAGALYSLYDTGTVYKGHPHNIAFEIAKTIENVTNAQVKGGDSYRLRSAIWTNPTYFWDGINMDTPTFSNGL